MHASRLHASTAQLSIVHTVVQLVVAIKYGERVR
jgi:hypothetical protein